MAGYLVFLAAAILVGLVRVWAARKPAKRLENAMLIAMVIGVCAQAIARKVGF